jgi:hypothetical protein
MAITAVSAKVSCMVPCELQSANVKTALQFLMCRKHILLLPNSPNTNPIFHCLALAPHLIHAYMNHDNEIKWSIEHKIIGCFSLYLLLIKCYISFWWRCILNWKKEPYHSDKDLMVVSITSSGIFGNQLSQNLKPIRNCELDY